MYGRVALTLLVGCGRFDFDPRIDAAGSEALGPWGPAEPIVAITPAGIQDPELSPDGLELFFTAITTTDNDIWISARASLDDPFPAGSPIAELSTPASEQSPGISGDGLTLYFSTPSGISAATRPARGAPFGPPTLVAGLLVGSEFVNDPELAPDARTAFVTHGSGDEREIYAHTRASVADSFDAGTAMSLLNAGGAADASAELSSDQLTIYFHSERAGAAGGQDIYYATRAAPGDTFSAPIPMNDFNTDDLEGDPTIGNGDRTFVFRRSVAGVWMLYIATR